MTTTNTGGNTPSIAEIVADLGVALSDYTEFQSGQVVSIPGPASADGWFPVNIPNLGECEIQLDIRKAPSNAGATATKTAAQAQSALGLSH